MTPDQIIQLRQLLKEIKVAAGRCQKDVFFFLKAEKALALLLCETCNGSGKTSKLFDECPECGCKEYTNENLAGEGYRQCLHCCQDWWTDTKYDIPCPDCQKNPLDK